MRHIKWAIVVLATFSPDSFSSVDQSCLDRYCGNITYDYGKYQCELAYRSQCTVSSGTPENEEDERQLFSFDAAEYLYEQCLDVCDNYTSTDGRAQCIHNSQWRCPSYSAIGAESELLRRLYSDGVVFEAGQAFKGHGAVKVKIYEANSGNKNLDRMMFVIGPYLGNTYESLPGYVKNYASTNSVDIVTIDAMNHNDYLENKGYASQRAIQVINFLRRQKLGVSENPDSVMIGLSLGGVVARFALTTIEDRGMDHGVREYISYDSPHSGAHVPLSVQYSALFLKDAIYRVRRENDSGFMADFFRWTDELLGEPLSIGNLQSQLNNYVRKANEVYAAHLDVPAVRQLLIQHIEAGGSRHSDSVALQKTLDRLGFPSLTDTNTAFVEGGSQGGTIQGVSQSFVNINRKELTGQNSKRVYLTLRVDSHTSPVFGYHNIFYGSLSFPKLPSFDDPKDRGSYSATHRINPSVIPMDNMPCSISAGAFGIANSISEFLEDPSALQFCFVPAISAVGGSYDDLGESGFDLEEYSEFDEIVASPGNKPHMSNLSSYATYMEFMSIFSRVY